MRSVWGPLVLAVSLSAGCEHEALPEPERKVQAALRTDERSAGADRGWLGVEVLGVDLPRGFAKVFVDGEERVVRGTPMQLMGLAPGDAVSLRFRAYGEETWLWPPADGGDVSRFTTWGTLTGPVEGVDPFGGALRVGGQPLRAHPEEVASLLPGERITLRFARVGEVWWALELEADAPPLSTAMFGRLAK